MHEWKQHAWNEATWQWLKPHLNSNAREQTMLRTGEYGLTVVPLRDLLWRYQADELYVGDRHIPFSALMPPQFAARAILEAQGLDDSAEAADTALSTPDGVKSLFDAAKRKNWHTMAYCFLPLSGEVLTEILNWLTQKLDGKYSATQARIYLGMLQANRTLSGRDLERVEEAKALLPLEKNKVTLKPGNVLSECSYHECLGHFNIVNDPNRKLESVRGGKRNLFTSSLHCENCDIPVWNITRYGLLLEEIFEGGEQRMDGRYAPLARFLLPFMGYRFAYMEETFTKDTPGEWLVELLTPSDEEMKSEADAFDEAMRLKYGIPKATIGLPTFGNYAVGANESVNSNKVRIIRNPVASPFAPIPKRGAI